MKVILLKDVARVGRKYDVVDIADGYALNRLIPGGSAEAATPESIARIQALKERASKELDTATAAFDALRTSVGGAPLEIAAEANEQGHLFKAVKPRDVAALLGKRGDIGLDPESIEIEMESPIKETGDHTVTLRLGAKEGTIIVRVTKK